MNNSKKLKQLNLFCQYILNVVPSTEKTIIQLADCGNFIVVKGKTTYEKDLDFNIIKNEFREKFHNDIESNFASHTIDLIEYKSNIKMPENFHFKYFNTENCFLKRSKIEKLKREKNKENLFHENLIIKTKFPIGLSNNMGKTIYYYGKLLVNSIPPSYPFDFVDLIIPTKFNETDFLVITENGQDLKLKSFFLDFYDFNFSKFEKKFDGYDFYEEILNPLFEPYFVREFPEDLILV